MSARPSSAMESHVLVAEDETDMLELIARRVQRLGHRVTRANDGREAMDALLRYPIDLVVTDINMPGYSGLEILTEAKHRDPNMQVIIVTANATMENAIDALNNGAFSYLTKPFDHISVISNAVTRALEFRRLTLDNIRMAKAQKRRGDMLEDEVTDRFRQLQRQEKTYRELLAQLPQGIILASINGRHMPKNPAAESWLAEDAVSESRPITGFLEGLVNGNNGQLEAYVQLGGRKLRLRASALGPQDDGVERVVVIEELLQESAPDVSTRLEAAVARLAKDLSLLRYGRSSYRGRDVLQDMAEQVRSLEIACQLLDHSAAP
jgi:DNA-binding response OmpR family regulator